MNEAVKTSFGFSQNTLEQIINTLKKYPELESAVIFGSRAKGNFREGSDIDIAVFSKTLSDSSFAKICSDLEELPLLFKIDCVHVEKLSRQALIDKIRSEGIQVL